MQRSIIADPKAALAAARRRLVSDPAAAEAQSRHFAMTGTTRDEEV